jgi:hypothetical protein
MLFNLQFWELARGFETTTNLVITIVMTIV